MKLDHFFGTDFTKFWKQKSIKTKCLELFLYFVDLDFLFLKNQYLLICRILDSAFDTNLLEPMKNG